MKDTEDLFKSIDTFNNGFITTSELKDHWKANAADLNDESLANLIKNFDLDSDRQISLDGKIKLNAHKLIFYCRYSVKPKYNKMIRFFISNKFFSRISPLDYLRGYHNRTRASS